MFFKPGAKAEEEIQAKEKLLLIVLGAKTEVSLGELRYNEFCQKCGANQVNYFN